MWEIKWKLGPYRGVLGSLLMLRILEGIGILQYHNSQVMKYFGSRCFLYPPDNAKTKIPKACETGRAE